MIEITMENGGVIRLELDAQAAPITVANFEKLARSGFYDGLIFHRVISGFMIQGGDPQGTGYGGSDENMPTTTLSEKDLTDGKIDVLSLLIACGLIASRSEGRRLIQGGGVMVNEEKVSDISVVYTAAQLKEGLKIRKGKKVYHKAVL